MERDDHSVVLRFGAIGFAELSQVLAGKLQPARDRVAANDRGAQRVFLISEPAVQLAIVLGA